MSSSEYQYVSTFDTTQTTQLVVNNTVKSSSTNNVLTSTDTASPESNLVQNGDLAAFVSHVLYLENKLRTETGNVLFDTENEVFGSKVDIGEGASFRVQRAEWRPKGNSSKSSSETKWGKYVALKAVRAKNNNGKSDWREVISEVRCLLHEPLRYHPNLVRLLGIGWGPSADSSSVYPQLVMEFSEIGSMDALQRSNEPLPFAIKQKLCYDIGRGLSILHACGIIHGDLNHRNVLIFPNKVKTAGQPYTAKISDFGGSIMDVTRNDSHLLRMSTWPYGAPEIGKSLTEEGIKKTDVYSFGLLIWRTVLDCGNILHVFDLTGERSSHSEEVVSNLKLGDSFLSGAEKSIHEYQATKGLHKDALAMIIHALKSTIQYEPSSRDLTRTQCILNGIDAKEIPAYLQWIDKKNDREAEQKRARAPGLHGITPEGLGAFLGRMGYDHDPQDNKPGYRPVLDHPEAGEFLFEPLRLGNILNWQQQQLIVKEFEHAASMAPHDAPVELQPHMAAFYLFQCYLTEFGTTFDPERVIHWLSQASSGPEDAGGVIYYAQAWIWRISNAFDMACPKPVDELKTCLKMSILRGHRTCLVDGEFIRDHSLNDDSPPSWDIILRDSRLLLNRIAAGLGMPYFAHRKLRRDYNLHDLPHLDDLIKQELGSNYNKCLRPDTTQPSDHPQEASERPKPPNFESIFVNHIGHGLLHYAATMGNYPALLYMISKYQVDIDVKDQTAYETPLVCACRSGNLKCAMLLLEHGADPNDSDSGVETPLYWLCSFNGGEMTELAQKLVDARAYIDGGGKNTMSEVLSDF
ncbi:hypothetical protein HYFRA_00006083 [Hymenoscyphus fraxineus]|uniref:Protein kinase domain-containing protein n=1 Tax=Hymenoscyphus fraxineus TaxID=746836 RepID=A0A9N9PSS3_9HELO|nr:hypothetical protein HYFRA_00006083 [Hymenoscyphus fraxineus]